MMWDEVINLYPNQWVLINLLDYKETVYDDLDIDYQSAETVKRTKGICSQISVIKVYGENLADSDIDDMNKICQEINENVNNHCFVNTKWVDIFSDK